MRMSAPIAAVLADETHLVIGTSDGVVRWYKRPPSPPMEDELDEERDLLWTMSFDAPMRSLVSSPDYTKVLATTTTGEVLLLTYLVDDLPTEPLPSGPSSIIATEKVAAFHVEGVVAAAPLPVMLPDGNVAEYDIVTCAYDGTLRCFHALTRMEIAQVMPSSTEPASSLAVSTPSMLIALGCADGVLRLYQRKSNDATDGLLMLVYRAKLSASSITNLAFSEDGVYLAAGCADGTLFTFKFAAGAAEPTLLPHSMAPSPPSSLAWTAAGELLLGLTDGKLLVVTPPTGLAGEVATLDACPVIMLQSKAVSMIECPATYTKNDSDAHVMLIAACEDRGVHVYSVPKRGAVGRKVAPFETILTCEKPPASLSTSMDLAFLAVGATDGTVTVAAFDALEEPTSLSLHDSPLGGVSAVALVPDVSPTAAAGGSLAYSCGLDGTMVLTTVSPSGYGKAPAVPTVSPMPLKMVAVSDKPGKGGAPAPPAPATTLDMEVEVPATPDVEEEGAADITIVEFAKAAATSGLAESAARDALFVKVEALRTELMELIAANEQLEEDDLEKLKPTDFIIDLEQQEKWRAEGTEQVKALKASIAAENLSNELVGSRMKSEFWSSMEEPQVTMHAMVVPGVAPGRQQALKVSSYTVPKQLPETAQTFAYVSQLRKVELKIDQWEAMDSGVAVEPYQPSASFESAGTFASDIGRVLSFAEQQALKDATQGEGAKKDEKKDEKKKEGEEEAAKEEEEPEEAKEEEVKMLYPPFELAPKWRKLSQMTLHGDVQRSLKKDFNDKLKALVNTKRAELEKIKERQERIGEIEIELSRLGAASDGEPTLEMGMHVDEEPEKLLEVSDAEVTAAKYLSKEEREKLAKAEEERKRKEAEAAKDNLGQRGLLAMMDGTLETKKAEDEIFIDLEKPDALIRQEAGEELLDDDKAIVKEFLEKQKKLDAEREKRSKGLLTELSKLRTEIQDICNNFNERVKTLKETKMAYDGALYESELLVIRLAQARLNKETFEKRSTELDEELVTQKDASGSSASALSKFTAELQKETARVEDLRTSDTMLEKGFKKDFSETPEFVEPLKKLFNRRVTVEVPKGTKAAEMAAKEAAAPSMAKAGMPKKGGMGISIGAIPTPHSTAAVAESSFIAGGRDPWTALDKPEMETMVEQLDAGDDMPEGLSFDVWDKLVAARDQKLDSEEKLKEAQSQLSQMQEWAQLLSAKDEKLRSRIGVGVDIG